MAEIDILSINNKKIQDVEARKDIQVIKENQINLIEDDTSMNGISDTVHDNLETANKTIIGGINEVNSQLKDIANDLGKNEDGSDIELPTTDKTVKGAIKELFQDVSNGKTLVANAITDKGVNTLATDTFQVMATNIGKISSGMNIEGKIITVNNTKYKLSTNSDGDIIATIIKHTVTNNLSNATNNNTALEINDNSSYDANISVNNGYKLSNVIVVMGGVNITSTVYSNGVISIPNVTGDIIITVTTINQNGVEVFNADFSGSTPSTSQFNTWENRVYANSIYDALSNIRCSDNTVHLTSTYDSTNSRWLKQMMSTVGLFETDNFVCEFDAKFSGTVGSWQNVITYGTGTIWTDQYYSVGVKWPASGEIDAFEQAGGYSDNPNFFKTPTAHWGGGTESGYPDNALSIEGVSTTFTPNQWHKFKFQLSNGVVKSWIDGTFIGEKDFSECVVNNNYMCDYKPFLKPQAFYIDGSCHNSSDTNNSYDFEVKNFKIYEDENIECTSFEIHPQMWAKNTSLIFPTNAEIFLDKTFTPSNVSNKACTWESSNPNVAKVVQGYVTTIAEGNTTITATNGNKTASYNLVVNNTNKNIPCAKVLITTNNLNLNVSDESTLTSYKYPKFTTDTISYTSSKSNVATVDNTGKIIAKGSGTCNITATCGTKTDSISVTVVAQNEPALKYDLSTAISKINERFSNWSNDKTDGIYPIQNIGTLGEVGNVNLKVSSSSTLPIFDIMPNDTKVAIPKTNTWLFVVKGYNPKVCNSTCRLKLNGTTNDNNMPTIWYKTADSSINIRYGSIYNYTSTTIPNIFVIGHDSTGYYLWVDGKIVNQGGSGSNVGSLYDIYGLRLSDFGVATNETKKNNIISFLTNFKSAVYLNAREDIESILTKDFGYTTT